MEGVFREKKNKGEYIKPGLSPLRRHQINHFILNSGQSNKVKKNSKFIFVKAYKINDTTQKLCQRDFM